MSEPFIGEIRMWACNYAPRGWAFCHGGTMSITDNTALFSIIGTVYGGDGRTTMGLPNLQGRAPMLWGRGPGLTNHLQGETSGKPTVPLEQSQIPSHDHILTGMKETGTSGTPDPTLYMGADRGKQGDNILYLSSDPTSNTSLAPETLATAGASQPHENRQPYSAVNFCIALIGLYPTRN